MIEHLIRDLANSLGHWAYLLVAVMATSETAAFVGFIAPGEFTIILGGVLAGQGTLSIQLLIGIVWASIVTGDSIGFLIGRRYGRNLLVKHGKRVRLTEERLAGVESYFKRHGGKTIFFGRWVGFVRPLMPFTAGSSGMPYRRFLPYDVLSAGLFGSFFTLLGYIFWRNFNTVTKVVGRGALGVGVLVALAAGGVFLFKRLRHREQRERLAAGMQALGRRPALRPLAFVLAPVWRYAIRPLQRWVLGPTWRYLLLPAGRALAPPLRFVGQRLTPGQLGIEFTTLVAIAAVAGFIFGAYTDVISSAPAIITPGDGFARDIALDIESGALTTFAKIVTVAGQWPVAAGVVALALPLLVARHRVLDAAVLVTGFGLTQAGTYIIKAAVDRPHPSDVIMDVGGASFPSGHAATAVTYVAVSIVAARMLHGNSARVVAVASAAALVVLVGLSRVYLRVHYMSDVFAGWAGGRAPFSLCGCVALVISFVRNNDASRRPRPIAAPAGTTSDG